MRLGALTAAVLIFGAGCGFGDGGAEEGNANALEVVREDGSKVEFPKQIRAWCQPYSNSEGEVEGEERQAVYVLGGDPPRSDTPPAFWIFSRAVEDIERSPQLEFPHEEGGHAALFVLDPKTGYELSSMEGESTGGLVVEEWGCEQGDAVRISVDARLQSEVHDEESVTPVEGEIFAVIGDPVALAD